jgi:hypothetical protein
MTDSPSTTPLTEPRPDAPPITLEVTQQPRERRYRRALAGWLATRNAHHSTPAPAQLPRRPTAQVSDTYKRIATELPAVRAVQPEQDPATISNGTFYSPNPGEPRRAASTQQQPSLGRNSPLRAR